MLPQSTTKRPKHNYRVARPCAGCGAILMIQVGESRRTATTFCSPECRARKVDRICPGCGTTFAIRQSSKLLYCSKRCWQANCREERNCAHCDKPFAVKTSQLKPTRGKYCSFACLKADRAVPFPSRKRPGHFTWRSAVLRRDGRACQRCGATNKLHAHHIKPWATYPELRYVVENGITLCQACHSAEHSANAA